MNGSSAPEAPWALLSRILAAVLGGLLLACAATVAVALVVPPARSLGVALAVTLFIPLWLTTMAPGFLARRPGRAWLLYIAGTGICTVIAWLAR